MMPQEENRKRAVNAARPSQLEMAQLILANAAEARERGMEVRQQELAGGLYIDSPKDLSAEYENRAALGETIEGLYSRLNEPFRDKVYEHYESFGIWNRYLVRVLGEAASILKQQGGF